MMKKVIGLCLAIGMLLSTNAFAADCTDKHKWTDDVEMSDDVYNVYVCKTCGKVRYEEISKIRDFIITLDPNGGLVDETEYITHNGKIKLPIPIRDSDYQFEGWYTEKDGGTEVTSDNIYEADTTLYAHWSVVGTYRLTFATDGGSYIKDIVMPYETEFNVSSYIPTKEGYTFCGWYLDPKTKENKVTDIDFASDTVLYAKWIENAKPLMMMNAKPVYERTILPNGWVVFRSDNGDEIIKVKCTPQWAKLQERLEQMMANK